MATPTPRYDAPSTRFAVSLLSVLLLLLASGLGVAVPTASAQSLPTAVGQLTAADVLVTCGPVSPSEGINCQFQLLAPPGTRFPADTAVSVFLSSSSAASALNAVPCQLIGSLGPSAFICQAQLPVTLPLPPASNPPSYQLVLSGGGQTQSFCGVLASFNPASSCGSS